MLLILLLNRVMYLNRVSAVAVVDQEGAVAANLSASDLRGISVSNLDQLLDNVYTFLEVDTRRRADQVKADQLKSVEPDTLVEAAVAIVSIIRPVTYICLYRNSHLVTHNRC